MKPSIIQQIFLSVNFALIFMKIYNLVIINPIVKISDVTNLLFKNWKLVNTFAYRIKYIVFLFTKKPTPRNAYFFQQYFWKIDIITDKWWKMPLRQFTSQKYKNNTDSSNEH